MDQFQASFINEANELLVDLEEALLILEEQPDDLAQVGSVFRVMHTLKGSASMFGFDKIGEFTHDLETIYDQIRAGQKKLTKDIFSLTLHSVDHIKALLEDPSLSEAGGLQRHQDLLEKINHIIGGEGGGLDTAEVGDFGTGKVETFLVHLVPNKDILGSGSNPIFLLEDLAALGEIKTFARANNVPSIADFKVDECFTSWDIVMSTAEGEQEIEDVFIFVEDDCDIQIDKVSDTDLFKSEGFVSDLETLSDTIDRLSVAELQVLSQKYEATEVVTQASASIEKAKSSIRVSSEKLDDLLNLVSQLVTTQARLALFAEEHPDGDLEEIAENVEKISRQLRENAFDLSLVPLENTLIRFRRLVRDISMDLGKEVDFRITGSETEMDKTIVERLIDPLMHILRNSLDHGIEKPAEREKKGKDPTGVLQLNAFYSGAYVHIQIKDDGGGIDPEKLRSIAEEKGIISKDVELTKKETLELIFAPGFSTASEVTDVSGRGVGMDVVRRNIESLRGEIELDSEIGKGTEIIIKLPLTLSIIDGLLVILDEVNYVIPLTVIKKCFEIDHDQLENNFNKLLVLEGEQVPYFYMREEFELEKSGLEREQLIVVVNSEKEVGLIVDEIVGEHQAVVKPLGRYYKDQEVFSGSTILGDGTVALVLDTNRIISKFSNVHSV